MLSDATGTANIPAGDLNRPRELYAEKLRLTPSLEFEAIFLVSTTSGGSQCSVYATESAGQAGRTIAKWHVDDVDAVVRELKSKGVDFEQSDDMPGVTWNDGVASMAGMGKAAW